MYDESFANWIGSVMELFDMTVNRIMGCPALGFYAGAGVFLAIFSLLAHLIRQGRKGKL